MEKIDLLEKLVDVQEQHIELMYDYNNLQCNYKSLEEVKNVKIKQLNEEINDLKREVEKQREINGSILRTNNDLNKQIEELQKLIPIELVDKEEENQ